MEQKHSMLIEGLMVDITYDFTEGDEGDWRTPPTGDMVTILSWRLLGGEKQERRNYPDYDDEEWEQWMQDIDHYVHNDAMWDILEEKNNF